MPSHVVKPSRSYLRQIKFIRPQLVRKMCDMQCRQGRGTCENVEIVSFVSIVVHTRRRRCYRFSFSAQHGTLRSGLSMQRGDKTMPTGALQIRDPGTTWGRRERGWYASCSFSSWILCSCDFCFALKCLQSGRRSGKLNEMQHRVSRLRMRWVKVGSQWRNRKKLVGSLAYRQ